MKKKFAVIIFGCAALLAFTGCEQQNTDTLSSAVNEVISGEEDTQDELTVQTPSGEEQAEGSNYEQQVTETETSGSDIEKEGASVEPIYFEGMESEILSQKAILSRDSYYRKVANDYSENVKGITDVDNYDYLFQTDTQYYTAEEFADCSDDILILAKNEIFARHGRMFENRDLYMYFLSRMWYVPRFAPEAFDESWLNEYEKANLKILLELTEGIEAKDMQDVNTPIVAGTTTPVASNVYLFQTDTQYYTAEEFADCTAEELRLAKNEIYARHGYVFKDAELKAYFLDQMWYVPKYYDGFDEKMLNDCERWNLQVLVDLGV